MSCICACFQAKIEKDSTDKGVDIKRNLRFAAWSGAYCGSIQHFVYNVLYLRMFPSTHIASRLLCTSFDTLVHGPWVYLPTYYVCKSLLTGGNAKDGLTEFTGNWWDIVTAYWKVWFPTVLITMTVIPMQFQILFISGVSLFWLMLLSYKAPMTDRTDSTGLVEEPLVGLSEEKSLAEPVLNTAGQCPYLQVE